MGRRSGGSASERVTSAMGGGREWPGSGRQRERTELVRRRQARRCAGEIMGKKNKSSKRKTRESEADTEVLSHKSLGEKMGLMLMDDLSEPTMGEKLASLKLEGDDKASNDNNVDSSLAKPPSADSVYILLKQALRADDRALLIACLYRQDAKVITNSLSLLNPSRSQVFTVSHINNPIEGAVGLCYGCAINSLYQLIESRVSTSNNALQLSSCLDLLYVETIDDGVEENTTVIPIIYEDEDESDDEGSEDSMEVENVEDGEEPQAYSDISDNEGNDEISD
ncbi:hypothetical protein Sango_2165600 [Sesamum angolense]|uniref:Uncharacterized protein n=1 Tax=Sesamum angolense TaxID=2727404 RepID=A0AAE2BMR3_9LAMI|nr:hypothetical protein Sango_2165600 [Sesamum angolense]